MTSLEQVSRMVIDDMKIGVLIPTFNNANTLQSVIKGCLHFTNNIIVVNDGSTDETGVILNQFPQIGVIHCETNQGKGMAIKRGFAEARSFILIMLLPSTLMVSIIRMIFHISLIPCADIRAVSSLAPGIWRGRAFRGKALSATGFLIFGLNLIPDWICLIPSQDIVFIH